MINQIKLQAKDSSLCAIIYPDFGANVGSIKLDGTEILMFDEARVGSIHSGGIPILFPFASKTKDDKYTFNEKNYRMIMHGFAKDLPFAIESVCEDSVTLWTDMTSAIMADSYPFDCVLKVKYSVKSNRFITEFFIENKSSEPMPHTLGIHPYFRTTDKTNLELEQDHKVAYDYVNEKYIEYTRPIDLSTQLDNVYCDCETNGFLLKNSTDRYNVKYELDKIFKVLVIFTGAQGAVCLEPWIGIPNSINKNDHLAYVPPKSTLSYKLELCIETV